MKTPEQKDNNQVNISRRNILRGVAGVTAVAGLGTIVLKREEIKNAIFDSLEAMYKKEYGEILDVRNMFVDLSHSREFIRTMDYFVNDIPGDGIVGDYETVIKMADSTAKKMLSVADQIDNLHNNKVKINNAFIYSLRVFYNMGIIRIRHGNLKNYITVGKKLLGLKVQVNKQVDLHGEQNSIFGDEVDKSMADFIANMGDDFNPEKLIHIPELKTDISAEKLLLLLDTFEKLVRAMAICRDKLDLLGDQTLENKFSNSEKVNEFFGDFNPDIDLVMAYGNVDVDRFQGEDRSKMKKDGAKPYMFERTLAEDEKLYDFFVSYGFHADARYYIHGGEDYEPHNTPEGTSERSKIVEEKLLELEKIESTIKTAYKKLCETGEETQHNDIHTYQVMMAMGGLYNYQHLNGTMNKETAEALENFWTGIEEFDNIDQDCNSRVENDL